MCCLYEPMGYLQNSEHPLSGEGYAQQSKGGPEEQEFL